MKAHYCNCESDTVRLDISALLSAPGAMLSDSILKQYISDGLVAKNKKSMFSNSSKSKQKEPALTLPNPKCQLCPKGHCETYPLIHTDDGKYAHKTCAVHVLETSVIEDPETLKLTVIDINCIPKERWKLV